MNELIIKQMNVVHYGGHADGDIKQHLKNMHESGAVAPTFKGYEPFKQLWDLGFVTPQITVIRLMFNLGRGDENYSIVDEENLEGVILNCHSGIPGVHNTKELLTNTKAKYWEISGLNPKAYRG
jgi:hypothetical protein